MIKLNEVKHFNKFVSIKAENPKKHDWYRLIIFEDGQMIFRQNIAGVGKWEKVNDSPIADVLFQRFVELA